MPSPPTRPLGSASPVPPPEVPGLPRAVLEAVLAEIPLAPGSVAIADLHLEAGSPAGADAFVELCGRLAGAPRLLVLGDLFDAWVGPAHLRLPGARRVLEAIAALTRAGTPVEVVHGNRDFLLGDGFQRACGATVHPFGLVGAASPSGERLLLVHGDELCTGDRTYQRLRRVLRSALVTRAAPRVPLPIALFLARRLRRASMRALAVKLPEEKRMQASAASFLARHHGAGTLVCGHAHRARDERLAGGLRWIVLDAFGDGRDALVIDAAGRPCLSSSSALGRP